MKKLSQLGLLMIMGILAASTVSAQVQKPKIQRRPAVDATASDVAPVKNTLGDGPV